MMEDCIFCSIAAGDTPADVVLETETAMFFRDINPKAEVHILCIPKKHITSVLNIVEKDEKIIGHLLRQAGEVAKQVGIAESGFRVIANTGPDSGQDVGHLHWHIIGGEPLGPLVC